jgi:hypothetical protein
MRVKVSADFGRNGETGGGRPIRVISARFAPCYEQGLYLSVPAALPPVINKLRRFVLAAFRF